MSAVQRVSSTKWLWLLLPCLLFLAAGCGRLSTEYGDSAGRTGRRSLNGFGAIRQTFTNAGYKGLDIRRLNDRSKRFNTIVWTPKYMTAIDSDVTNWMESWLRGGGRTLVLVIPDSGSEAYYWQDASRLAAPEKRLEYRRRAAGSINERIGWRLNRVQLPSNGWFVAEPLGHPNRLRNLSGEWANKWADNQLLGNAKRLRPQLDSEFDLQPFSANQSASTAGSGGTSLMVSGSNGATGPGSPPYRLVGSATPTSTPIEFKPLLMDASGTTIVAKVVSERWKDSSILVVAGGSLLTNYAFTDEFSLALADQIVQASLDNTQHSTPKAPLRAGFISLAPQMLAVSESDPGVPKATGMELLTVWPISLVTIHLVLLGLIICLMLLPSLGRPRRVQYSEQSNFGDHLDAVAALMVRAKGEQFAKNRISEYMRRIHGETSGPWVQPPPPPPQPSQPTPPSAGDERGVQNGFQSGD